MKRYLSAAQIVNLSSKESEALIEGICFQLTGHEQINEANIALFHLFPVRLDADGDDWFVGNINNERSISYLEGMLYFFDDAEDDLKLYGTSAIRKITMLMSEPGEVLARLRY